MRTQYHYCNGGVGESLPERGLLGLVGCFEGRDANQDADRRRQQRHCTKLTRAGKIKVERSEALWPRAGVHAGIHLISCGPCAPAVADEQERRNVW